MRPLVNRLHRADDGIAVVAVLLVAAVLTAVTATATLVVTNNLQNTSRDRAASAALQTAEGGVAQAIAYVKANGITKLTCLDALGVALDPSCTSLTEPWANPAPAKSQRVTVGDSTYRVWIGLVSGVSLPAKRSAQLRIHSTAEAGVGPGRREVVVDLSVKPFDFPMGLYADSAYDGGGDPHLHNVSLFSAGCVKNRDDKDSYDAAHVPVGRSGGGLSFSGIDAYYGIPAAAHAVQTINTRNGCGPGDRDNVHRSTGGSPPGVCNMAVPYDQDGEGGSLASTTCNAYHAASGYATRSSFTMRDLEDYGYTSAGLTVSQYSALKTIAQQQGTYYTSAPTGSWLAGSASRQNAVVYIDLPTFQTVKLGPGDVPGEYARDVNPATCPGKGLVIVIRNGDLDMAANSKFAGVIFVPEGEYKGAGSVQVIGTIFAKNMRITGTQDFWLDKCFTDNIPSSLLDVTIDRYHEVDR